MYTKLARLDVGCNASDMPKGLLGQNQLYSFRIRLASITQFVDLYTEKDA